MILKNLIKLLNDNKNASLLIMLPSRDFIPEHFHVTEVGRVYKSFIDCGGTHRKSVSCLLQVWTAYDVEHRLDAGRLAKILKLGEKVLKSDNLPVVIEYGNEIASQYSIANVEVTPEGLLFLLTGKQTNCLAPDKCGTKCQSGDCCTGIESV